METCPFCGAQVPDGLLGFHYGGWKMPPCPDVALAFGADDPTRYNTREESDYPAPGVHAARGPHGHGQTRAEYLEKHRALNVKYQKRRTPHHLGERL